MDPAMMSQYRHGPNSAIVMALCYGTVDGAGFDVNATTLTLPDKYELLGRWEYGKGGAERTIQVTARIVDSQLRRRES